MDQRFPQIDIGKIKVTALSAGRVKMDGGAMFGVVPRGLWSKRITPDDRNRIDLQMWCLLVETGNESVLIETEQAHPVVDPPGSIEMPLERHMLQPGLEIMSQAPQ